MRIINVAALSAAICSTSLLPYGAFASVIFDQSINLSATAIEGEPQLLADDFGLQPGANMITDIHWWGTYGFGDTPTEPDNFTIRIFADIGGVPDTSPLNEFVVGNVGRTDTGFDLGGVFEVYSYSANIPALTLTANTTFWLSIQNATPTDTDDNWFWSAEFGGNGKILANTGQWFGFNDDHDHGLNLAFQLTNDGVTAVPEPASIALFAVGLAGPTGDELSQEACHRSVGRVRASMQKSCGISALTLSPFFHNQESWRSKQHPETTRTAIAKV